MALRNFQNSINPDHAGSVKQIFNYASEGKGLIDISKALIMESIISARGKVGEHVCV